MSNDSMNASIPSTNIILTGFMGTGKSSVGRCLAENFGFAFLDTDALIESEVGATISDIFRTRGERWFRQMEVRVVRRAAKLNNTVISLGGGALIDQRNVDAAKRSGVVVWLRASPEAVLARLSGDAVNGIDARPVLGGEADIERLRLLMRVREPGYGQAHITVDTDGKSPGEVACEVARAVSMHLSAPGAVNSDATFAHSQFAPGGSVECGVEWTNKGSDLGTKITAGTATYPYFVGQGTLTRLGTCLSSLEGWSLERSENPRRVIVVTNSLLRCLFGTALERGLHDWSAGSVDIAWAVVPEGESAKTLSTLDRLYGLACTAGAKRDCLVVALGGGTVGDVAGFFAATYMRGVRLVHVPTTLLAMVDSAVGGKTAINLKAGKNLAGTFWQPISVVSDVATVKTLPLREFTNGLAEAVKAAVIGDPVLFDTLDSVAETVTRPLHSAHNPATRRVTGGDGFAVARVLQHDPGLLQAIICRAVAVKARIVSRDERDTGERLLLNLGHTLGHAIEQAGGFRRWTHGEAVAIGLSAACRASTRLGRLSPESSERVINLLSRIGLPTSLSREQAARLGERIKGAMLLDKKADGGGLRVILPSSIGQCSVANDVPAEILLREMVEPSDEHVDP